MNKYITKNKNTIIYVRENFGMIKMIKKFLKNIKK